MQSYTPLTVNYGEYFPRTSEFTLPSRAPDFLQKAYTTQKKSPKELHNRYAFLRDSAFISYRVATVNNNEL